MSTSHLWHPFLFLLLLLSIMNPVTPTPTIEPTQDINIEPTQDINIASQNYRWGDPMTATKPEGSLRLFVQNPNGIAAANNFSEFAFICQSMKSREVDIFGLSEVAVDWKNYHATTTCRQIARKFWDHSRFIGSTSNVKAPKIYKPGGTCMVATGKWTGRIDAMKTDPSLGRWSYTRITGRNRRKVLIVTLYQVCKNTIKRSGARQAFTQQWAILRAKGDKSPDPRKQLYTDLDEFLGPYAAAGDEIILMGDFNEWLGDMQQTQLRALILKYGLHDVLAHYHNEEASVASYKRGSKRIDYFLATEHLTASVVQCGMLPFDEVISSDHRGIFVDIDVDAFLGGDPPTLMSSALRGISSSSPTQCKTYVTTLHTTLTNHNVFHRCQTLQTHTASHGLTDRLKLKWEALDRDFSKACALAEKRTSRSDRPPWSPKLHHAHLAILYWKTTVSGHRHNRDVRPVTDSFLTLLTWTSHPPQSLFLDESKLQLKEAQSQIRQIRKDAMTHREDFLKERAEAEALRDDTDMEKMYRRILRAESTKEAHAILRNFLKPRQSGGISAIDVLQPDGSRRTISEPMEMEAKILRRNHEHYNQAQGTPFTMPPLKDMLGLAGETELAQAILSGNISPILQDVFPETQVLFDQIPKAKPNLQNISIKVTRDDFKKFFGKWKESTATSDERHLGHWKALLSPALLEDDIATKADQIIDVLLSQVNLALEHGYSWERWRRIITMMIEKKPGNYNLEKLRCIHLFEADFNWILGLIFGRRMIHQAENEKLLHDNQWGSRPGRSAPDAVLLKQLSYEIARLTRTPLGSFDNDAQACYDRIIMSMALLLCQKHGVPSGPCIMAALTLLYSSYFIKTKYGVSSGSYQSTTNQPTHGPGQGSRMGPALWVLISCLMFAAMEQLCRGATFCNPSGTLTHQRTGDGFVDDVTNVFNFGIRESLSREISVEEMAAGLQRESQTWERLLWSTGGKLELSKCFYYLMIWDFRADGHPFLLRANKLGLNLIKLTSGNDDQRENIEHKDCKTAHRTLGMWPTPTGDMKEQFLVSKAKSDHFAGGVKSHPLTRLQANMAYSHMWLPSIGYPLPCTFMTLKQLDQVQRSAINAFLPKMGFSSKSPRIVVFGSPTFGGMGLRHLYHEQGIQQTTMLFKHLRHGGSVGQLLRIGLEWFQHYLGVPYSVLEFPSRPLPHAPVGWFSSIIGFLSFCDASIRVAIRVPQPLRVHDQNLMEGIISLKLPPSQTRILNYCRIFLQIEMLSEITTIQGDTILRTAWQGLSLISNSKLLWPKQRRPHEKAWCLWRNALATLYLQSPPTQVRHTTTHNLRLRTSLGPWINQRFDIRTWHAYQATDHSLVAVSHHNDPSYHYYHATYHNRRTIRLANHPSANPGTTLPQSIPSDLPSPHNDGSLHVSISFSINQASEEAIPDHTSFSTLLSSLPTWERPLLQHVRPTQPVPTLSILLASGVPLTLHLVSDGGAKLEFGSFGWVLASETVIYWEAMGPTFGYDPGSFRAESYGMLSLLRFLHHYMIYHQIAYPPELSIQVYCDNEGLIKRVQGALSRTFRSPNSCLASEYDLEIAILETVALLPYPITFHHVLGHQDTLQPDTPLSWAAQLNVRCDELATLYLDTHAIPEYIVPLIPVSQARLDIGGNTVTRKYDRALREAATTKALPKHLCDKFHWDLPTLRSINWTAHGAALRTFRGSDHVFIIKYLFNLLPIGRRRSRVDPRQPSGCPSCPNIIETGDHLFSCPSRQAWRAQFFLALEDHLKKLCTAPHLGIILTRALRRLSIRPDVSLNTHLYAPHERQLLHSQEAIEWRHLLSGRFSLLWAEQQQIHITTENMDGRVFSGSRWQQKIIQFLWSQMYGLWKSRNDDLHAVDPNAETESHRRKITLQSVRDLYDTVMELPIPDRLVFDLPLATRLAYKTEDLEAWISTITPAVQQAMEEFERTDPIDLPTDPDIPAAPNI